MTRRICITGPEATGKSSLAETLAGRFRCEWVEEYARTYLRGLGRAYRESDLEAILRGQLEAEDASPGLGRDPFLFCDTGPEVIWVWSFFKYGRVSPAIDDATRRRGYSGTILLDVDLPWTPDPLRENPSEKDRRELLGIYQNLLGEIERRYILVGGRGQSRLTNALTALEAMPATD